MCVVGKRDLLVIVEKCYVGKIWLYFGVDCWCIYCIGIMWVCNV